MDAKSMEPRRIAKRGKRTGVRRSSPAARLSELGALLSDLRRVKRLSLREVEDATDRAISNAYLSQLENGRIGRPSPNVLHTLAATYAVPYEGLMEKAGYLVPALDPSRPRRAPLAVFSIDDLSAEEEEDLLKYLAFIRSRSRKTADGRR